MDAKPKHPQNWKYAPSLAGAKTFKELDARIASLGSDPDDDNKGKPRGDAFEVWIEGYLAVICGIEPANLFPWTTEGLELRERFGLPIPDKGIDGMFCDPGFSAYQCKYRTGLSTLSWRDVDTFFGLCTPPPGRQRFEHKFVLSNCTDFAPELRARAVCIGRSTFDELKAEQFAAIDDWLARRPSATPKKSPRNDQTEAIQKINESLESADRSKCIQACGTGKTLVSLWLKEDRAPQTTLVLVPSLGLMRQLYWDWLAERKQLYYSLCICSDATVKIARTSAEAAEQSDIGIEDCDFPVSTSAADTGTFAPMGQMVVIPAALVTERKPGANVAELHGLRVGRAGNPGCLLEIPFDLPEIGRVMLGGESLELCTASKHHIHPVRRLTLDFR